MTGSFTFFYHIVYDVFFFAGGGLESLNLFKFHQFSILKQPLDHDFRDDPPIFRNTHDVYKILRSAGKFSDYG